MIPNLIQDAYGNPIPVVTVSSVTNIADTEDYTNETNNPVLIRVVATDGDATVTISEDGTGDGIFLGQAVPEYFFLPAGRTIAVADATVNMATMK